MKYPLLFVLSALILSCHKDHKEVEIFLPGQQLNGFWKATKQSGGESAAWEASGSARPDTSFSPNNVNITSSTYDDQGQLRENLVMLQIPLVPGHYNINDGFVENGQPETAYSRLVSDGDALGAQYFGVGGENWVEITEIDTSMALIKGRFDLKFEIDPSDKESGFPEIVRFKDGTFEVKIIR